MSRLSTPPFAKALSRVVRIVVGLAILGAGFGIAAMLVATRPTPPRAVRPEPTLQVRTLLATADDVPRRWRGYGTARAMNTARIPAQVAGVVVERPASVEPGMPIGGEADLALARLPSDPGALLARLRETSSGALLVRIDPSDYLARLESALQQASATQAQIASLDVQSARLAEMLALSRDERQIQQRELARAIAANEQGGGNETEIERRRTAVLVAQRSETNLLEQLDLIEPRRSELLARLRDQRAAAELARLNLARTVVTSPIAGTIQEVMARPGEWLPAGAAVAQVTDLSRVEVPLRLPIAAAAAVAVGDRADLRTDSAEPRAWSGKVVRIAPEADPQTRTFTAFVEVEQDPGSASPLLPGQFVVGAVRTGRTERVMLVPRRAVEDDHVYVAATAEDPDGRSLHVARRIPVSVLFHIVGDMPDLDPVETQWSALRIGERLRLGDPVIVSNLDDLHEGLLVGLGSAPVRAAAGEPPAGHAAPGPTP